MSYNIEPMTIISFLDENKLKLPRFQRKSTWNNKQNFELCISVFQEYPIGVVIVNKEKNSSWLLDGRQRRNALKQMRENPVSIYEWAQSFLKFKKTEDPIDITNIFWDKIAKYLQTEQNENENKKNIIEEENVIYDELDDEDCIENDEVDSFNKDAQKKGLQTLLDIVKMVHQNKPNGSAWENLFDYTKYFSKLPYAPLKNGERKVEPIALRRFILDVQRACDGELTLEFFKDYYNQLFDYFDDKASKKFSKFIDQNWDSIKNSFDIIERSEKIYSEARIGIIWLRNATPLDAQNIFSRINSGGTQLKAEELLSAKPFWNINVETNSNEIIEKVEKLYENLHGIKPETIVRWDMAAILISRIDNEHLIFDSYENIKRKNEISLDEITLGFKLLSSIYNGGMSAKHVADLEKADNINWERDINILVEELNTMFRVLMSCSFFKTFQSWNKPVAKLLGNAIALEYITILYLDWKYKGCPVISSGELKAFQRDAIILFDRLIFEYSTKVWRGSGDSKMANDIKNWKNRINSIDKLDWDDFIKNACEGSYKGSMMTVNTLKPILYYYYTLVDCLPINTNNTIFDVDHIIPQEKFNGNSMVNPMFENCLCNLALLPKKDNISKSSKTLNEIVDPWLKSMITTYTGVDESDFEKFSDITNIQTLKEQRKILYLTAFDINRSSKLSN